MGCLGLLPAPQRRLPWEPRTRPLFLPQKESAVGRLSPRASSPWNGGVGLPALSVSAPPLITFISAQKLDPASGLTQRALKGSNPRGPRE